MEQKLAQFRARRQAENAAKKTKSPEVPTEAAGVRSLSASTCEREQAEEAAADSSSDVPESSGSQVRCNFLLFSFLYLI